MNVKLMRRLRSNETAAGRVIAKRAAAKVGAFATTEKCFLVFHNGTMIGAVYRSPDPYGGSDVYHIQPSTRVSDDDSFVPEPSGEALDSRFVRDFGSLANAKKALVKYWDL